MTLPNPVRTLESHGVVDQTAESFPHCEPDQHYMRSIKTNSAEVPYVEQCATCLWVDGASLSWWANNTVKQALSNRAARMAVAIETEPFAFVQSSMEELKLSEVLGQALGAASTCWVGGTGSLEFDGTRAKDLYEALMREVARFQRLALEDAATRAVDYIYRPGSPFKSEAFCIELRQAIEGTA